MSNVPRRLSRRPLQAAVIAILTLAGGATAQIDVDVDLRQLETGKIHPRVIARVDPSTSYALYLPTDFDPARRWPLLVVFDPRQQGARAAEIFRPAAERHGWIVASSNDTRSDTPDWAGNVKAINGLFPDVEARLPVEADRVYAAGMSGGALLAWILGQQTGELAGVISVGGRPPEGYIGRPPRFAHWATAGRLDFNHDPSRELDRLAANGDRPHRFARFEGIHGWFSPNDARRAVDWLEITAMQEKRRAVDPALVREIFRADLAQAEATLAAGDLLAGMRELQEIAETYRGLVDIAEIEQRAAELENHRDVRAAIKQEKRGEDFEIAVRRRVAEIEYRLRNTEIAPLGQLERILQIGDILRRTGEEGPMSDAARRAVAVADVQLSFYQARSFMQAGEYVKAATALGLAVQLRPENAGSWYNLACAQARTGKADDALESLSRAVDLGVRPGRPIREDPDLASLRDRTEFQELSDRLLAVAGPGG